MALMRSFIEAPSKLHAASSSLRRVRVYREPLVIP
jgi:hypothetical protein